MSTNKDVNTLLSFIAKSIALMLLNLFIVYACKKESSQWGQTVLSGTIRNQQTQENNLLAPINWGNQLLTYTPTGENCRIEDFTDGNYSLMYSVIGFYNYENQILVNREVAEITPVLLVSNDGGGMLIGEYHSK